MSTNSPKDDENQEVDLSMISKGISNFFQQLNTALFKGIQFVIRNSIIISVLFFLGIGIGFYLDKTQKTYDHQIIVSPNFGSTDYLYSQIDLIESKIKEKDTVFLNSIGIKVSDKLSKIEIEPIIDVYKFVSSGTQNFELLKLLAEDGDLKKIVEEKTTSKNYAYHVISFTTKDFTSHKRTIEPLLAFLNNSEFYRKIQKEHINNVRLKTIANDITIAQIDGFLNTFSNTVNANSKSDKLVYYNENTQLNEVIQTKDKLIIEQGQHRMDLVSLDKIIKENSSTINIENNKSVNGKLKFILPFLFIFIFIFIYLFLDFYKRQANKIIK